MKVLEWFKWLVYGLAASFVAFLFFSVISAPEVKPSPEKNAAQIQAEATARENKARLLCDFALQKLLKDPTLALTPVRSSCEEPNFCFKWDGSMQKNGRQAEVRWTNPWTDERMSSTNVSCIVDWETGEVATLEINGNKQMDNALSQPVVFRKHK